MAKRIYRIDEHNGAGEVTTSFLVRAPNGAQAVRHVARRFKCEMATQDDLIDLAGKGVKVQEITEYSK